jgi:uncharacterized protein
VRRWPRPGLRSRLAVVVGDVVKPTPLEIWLTARWGAHTRKAGRTWWAPNEHAEWPLHAAEIVELHDDLLDAAGVSPAGDPLRALYSPGTYARFGRPSIVSRGYGAAYPGGFGVSTHRSTRTSEPGTQS